MPTVPTTSKRKPWEWVKPKDKGWRSTGDKRYDSREWRSLTKLVRSEEPFCRECQKKGVTTLAKVTDHIQAVRLGGNFWERSNLQPLCESCHNGKKV